MEPIIQVRCMCIISAYFDHPPTLMELWKTSLCVKLWFWNSVEFVHPTSGDHNLNKLKSKCFHTSFSTSGQMVYEKRVFTRFFSYVLWSTGSTSLYWPISHVVKLCLGLEPTLVERFCNSNNLIVNKVFTVFAQLLNKY